MPLVNAGRRWEKREKNEFVCECILFSPLASLFAASRTAFICGHNLPKAIALFIIELLAMLASEQSKTTAKYQPARIRDYPLRPI